MILFNKSIKKLVWGVANFLKMDSLVTKVLEAPKELVSNLARLNLLVSGSRGSRASGAGQDLSETNCISCWKLEPEATIRPDTSGPHWTVGLSLGCAWRDDLVTVVTCREAGMGKMGLPGCHLGQII